MTNHLKTSNPAIPVIACHKKLLILCLLVVVADANYLASILFDYNTKILIFRSFTRHCWQIKVFTASTSCKYP